MSKVYVGHYKEFDNLDGYTLVDLHSHTSLSDGRDDPSLCLKRAKKRGINLCISDHNQIHGSLLASQRGLSLPSIEVTSKDCYDFLMYFSTPKDLALFFNKYIKGHRLVEDNLFNFYRLRWPTEDLLEKAKEFNAVTVLAHPDALPPKNSGIYIEANKQLLKNIDAVEVMNATMSESANKKALELAKTWKKPMTGASDAHLSRYIGTGVTAFESNTVADILEDIRKGNNVIIGKNLRFRHKLKSTFTVIKNNLRW